VSILRLKSAGKILFRIKEKFWRLVCGIATQYASVYGGPFKCVPGTSRALVGFDYEIVNVRLVLGSYWKAFLFLS
jgi:hypothetical protein